MRSHTIERRAVIDWPGTQLGSLRPAAWFFATASLVG